MKNKFDHFGLLAPFYERFIPPREPQKLLELLSLSGGETLLDAGGGTGRLAQFLVGKAALVVIGDESMKMLREAGAKEGLRPVCSLTEQMPFAGGSFERIMIVDALHHVGNQAYTAAELWRILKPGGRLIIEEPNIRTLRIKLVALAEKLALMRSHFLAGDEIQGLFVPLGAVLQVVCEDTTVWVIVEKPHPA